eukprot:CAMPEP_0202696422 /NCGR_PEP_ID=MMETSP1385-20130828/9713_1 /ASSEMBLY_ACC=CAM_ASM_000861 /TAXON_ID=933848 /ORGANISM="Elphidium margaritaceum" /LENGTH=58 /DNA_ID=CAMNT_0049352585 /DNA_START=29 /DNA_END=202 /DNA_ORIENTATION=-
MAAVTTSDSRCDAIGECSYITLRRPCSMNNANVYSIQPVLTETCYATALAFKITCASF